MNVSNIRHIGNPKRDFLKRGSVIVAVRDVMVRLVSGA